MRRQRGQRSRAALITRHDGSGSPQVRQNGAGSGVTPAQHACADGTGERRVENTGAGGAARRQRDDEQRVYDSSANSRRSAFPQSRSRS